MSKEKEGDVRPPETVVGSGELLGIGAWNSIQLLSGIATSILNHTAVSGVLLFFFLSLSLDSVSCRPYRSGTHYIAIDDLEHLTPLPLL